jgi:hypothetical protein
LILMVLAVLLFFAVWAASGDVCSAGIAALIAWAASEYRVSAMRARCGGEWLARTLLIQLVCQAHRQDKRA